MSDRSTHMEDYFFYMRDGILKKLKTERVYHEYYREANHLREQFPIIDKLIEGQNMGQKVELTRKEWIAFKEYADLQGDMQDMTEREYYYRGHRDCLLYLIRCGMFDVEQE